MTTDAVLSALEEVERAIDKLRTAYAEWLGRDGQDDAGLRAALAEAEERLVAARELLARAAE